MSAQLPAVQRAKPKRKKRSNSALDLVARVRKRKAKQRQLYKARREKERALRDEKQQQKQQEEVEEGDLLTEEPEVESESESEVEVEAELAEQPEDIAFRMDQAKVDLLYLEPANPENFVKASSVVPEEPVLYDADNNNETGKRQKRQTKKKESVEAIPKDLPKNAVRRRVPDGYAYFIPKDASKGMGCGKCRFSKRGCMRCSVQVCKDEESGAAAGKPVVKAPVQREKKSPAIAAVAGRRKKVAMKVVPKQQQQPQRQQQKQKKKQTAKKEKVEKKKKKKNQEESALIPEDLPKNAILRRVPDGYAYFSPKDASKGMGCGKCRFSKRGCMRCSAQVSSTMEAKNSTKQPKRPREAPNAEISTPLKKNKTEKKASVEKLLKRRTPKVRPKQTNTARVGYNKFAKALADEDDGKRVHLLSGEIVNIQESPKSVLDRAGAEERKSPSAQQKNGQEHCFPKLSKFVRPVRIPIKSGHLFDQEEPEPETSHEVAGDNQTLPSKSRSDEKQEHTWKDLNWWNYKDSSICNQVKNVLHMSSSFDTTKGEPKIRHEEWTTIKRFILGKLTKGSSGSLYVSGVPGSGKSFIVQQAIASSMYSLFGHSTKKKTKVVHINCMTLQDPRRIFNILLEKGFDKQCSTSAYEKDHRYALSHLRKAVSSASKTPKRGPGEMVIIVLDEIDHLFQNQGNVLYDLFSLAEIQSSNVVLIGIANSIDMTLRMLPHLHTIGVQPAMVNFRAYVHSELLSLMQERLHSLDGPVFGEKAIELCSRKIAAESGDMRQCLNAAYAALEIHIAHMKASESQDGGCVKKFVDLQHMSLALGKCLKLPLINGMRALPQHQQMILCSTALMKKEGEVLLTSLFSKYSELCKSTKICSLAFNEFENACTSLHDQGLVALNKKANLHSKGLKLKVKMSDIVFALQGIRFFHAILNRDK